MNVVNEKAQETVIRYSELIGNYERMAEKIIPPIQMIGHKVTDLTYVIITKQVSLINQDPKRQYGVFKLSLIDLETYVMQEAA